MKIKREQTRILAYMYVVYIEIIDAAWQRLTAAAGGRS